MLLAVAIEIVPAVRLRLARRFGIAHASLVLLGFLVAPAVAGRGWEAYLVAKNHLYHVFWVPRWGGAVGILLLEAHRWAVGTEGVQDRVAFLLLFLLFMISPLASLGLALFSEAQYQINFVQWFESTTTQSSFLATPFVLLVYRFIQRSGASQMSEP